MNTTWLSSYSKTIGIFMKLSKSNYKRCFNNWHNYEEPSLHEVFPNKKTPKASTAPKDLFHSPLISRGKFVEPVIWATLGG